MLARRLAEKDIVEPSEEVRLELVQVLSRLLDSCDASAPSVTLKVHVEDMLRILARTLTDPYPDIKKVHQTQMTDGTIIHLSVTADELSVRCVAQSAVSRAVSATGRAPLDATPHTSFSPTLACATRCSTRTNTQAHIQFTHAHTTKTHAHHKDTRTPQRHAHHKTHAHHKDTHTP